MDKAQAIHTFWSSFELTAYDENTVPDNATLPYITYNVSESDMGSPVSMTASLWYKSTSWAAITQKADEISRYITSGGKTIKLNKGYLYLYRGTPFAQRMSDPDTTLRRIVLNIAVEYLTAD